MKKCISILLLLMMLVAGAHPVLAFHFCGGELYSFGMAGSGVEKTCCLVSKPTSAEADKDTIAQSHTGCCDIQKISISTDNYQNQPSQSNISQQALSLDHACLAPESSYRQTTTDYQNLTNNAFPPGGLAIRHIDILTGICIFRI